MNLCACRCFAFCFALAGVLMITRSVSSQNSPRTPPVQPVAAPATPEDDPTANLANRSGQNGVRKTPAVTTPFLPALSVKEQRILAALADDADVEFVDTPLVDAVQYLSEVAKIPIIVDQSSLNDEGIPSDEPVHLKVSSVTLRSALSLMLDDLGMTWVVEDEVLKITSKTKAREKQLTRVYPVADLIDPHNDDSFGELITAIQSSVPEATWEEVDGSGGAVNPVSFTKSLVIRQSRKAHEGIVTLLDSLREAQKLAGTMEKERPADRESLPASLFRPEQIRPNEEPEIVDLPIAVLEPVLEEQLRIELTLDRSGQPQVKLNNRTEPLDKALKRLETVKARSAILYATGNVKHESLITVISTLQKSGVDRFSISAMDYPRAVNDVPDDDQTGIPIQ